MHVVQANPTELIIFYIVQPVPERFVEPSSGQKQKHSEYLESPPHFGDKSPAGLNCHAAQPAVVSADSLRAARQVARVEVDIRGRVSLGGVPVLRSSVHYTCTYRVRK